MSQISDYDRVIEDLSSLASRLQRERDDARRELTAALGARQRMLNIAKKILRDKLALRTEVDGLQRTNMNLRYERSRLLEEVEPYRSGRGFEVWKMKVEQLLKIRDEQAAIIRRQREENEELQRRCNRQAVSIQKQDVEIERLKSDKPIDLFGLAAKFNQPLTVYPPGSPHLWLAHVVKQALGQDTTLAGSIAQTEAQTEAQVKSNEDCLEGGCNCDICRERRNEAD